MAAEGDGVAEEATSVLAWFEFYTRLYEDENRVARPSHTLLQVLQSAFPVLYDENVSRRLMLGAGEWASVIALLEAFYEVELRINQSMLKDAMTFEDASTCAGCVQILEFVVCAVVQSDNKARFVRDIMTMEGNVQVDIMAVIERTMSRATGLASAHQNSGGSNATANGHDDASTNSGAAPDGHHDDSRRGSPARPSSRQLSDSPASSGPRSPLHLARNAEMERMKRANDILTEENAHIMDELLATRSKYECMETEHATLLQSIEELKLQAEMDVLKKERTVRSFFDERMHSMQRELDHAAAKLEEQTAIAKDVHELRDEIDLLRPAAEKLTKAEATLAKYKTKIEELTSAKEKLRRTEEANAELVEKNLSLENQAAKAVALQRKLTDSKEANTTIQFRVSELELQLSRVSAELELRRVECESSAAALAEVRSVNQQLQQTVDHQVEAKSGFHSSTSGSAGSISELSPELMEKLARLEHDNMTLRSQVDGTTSDRIDTLMDELDDANRMKKSFEVKYFDTNEVLKETQAKLEAAEGTVKVLQASLETRTHELDDMTADRDEKCGKLGEAEQQIRDLHDANNARQAEILRFRETQGRLEVELARHANEIDSLQATLSQTTQELRLSNERSDHLQEDVAMHQIERQEAATLRDNLYKIIQNLERDVAMRQATHEEVEENCARLCSQLTAAQERINSIQERDACNAMRCEELLLKVEQIQRQRDSATEQVQRLNETNRDMKNRFEGQESKLKEAIRAQLDTNQKLMATNQTLKTVLSGKEAQVLQLEKAVTRLDSRIFVFEREQAHNSSDDGKKRDADDSDTASSTEVSSHVAQVLADYDVLRKENKELHDQLARRQSNQIDDEEAGTPHSAKTYLMERIRQVELAKAQEENKKREILLVNAKLIQDQKMLQVKHAGDAKELHSLKEKINTWMLRDERRKKEHECFAQRVQSLEAENKKLRMMALDRSSGTLSQDGSSLQFSQESLELTEPLRLRSTSSEDQENIPPNTETASSPTQAMQRKRKLDDAAVDDEDSVDGLLAEDEECRGSRSHSQQPTPEESEDKLSDETDRPVVVVASAAAPAPRAKRRMSHFMSNRMAVPAAPPAQDDEKPSECTQQ